MIFNVHDITVILSSETTQVLLASLPRQNRKQSPKLACCIQRETIRPGKALTRAVHLQHTMQKLLQDQDVAGSVWYSHRHSTASREVGPAFDRRQRQSGVVFISRQPAAGGRAGGRRAVAQLDPSWLPGARGSGRWSSHVRTTPARSEDAFPEPRRFGGSNRRDFGWV